MVDLCPRISTDSRAILSRSGKTNAAQEGVAKEWALDNGPYATQDSGEKP